MFEIKIVRPSALWEMRQRVLRPDQSLQAAQYPEDVQGGALHLAVMHQEEIIGVASFYNEDEPAKRGDPHRDAWRLRGMATAERFRSQGVGGSLLAAASKEIRCRGGAFIWCNARAEATKFYQRHGFRITSGVFDIPDVGPHFVMQLLL